MLAPIAQLWLLVVFAIVGVLVGLAQMVSEVSCSCCGLSVSRTLSTCPHCRCRMG